MDNEIEHLVRLTQEALELSWRFLALTAGNGQETANNIKPVELLMGEFEGLRTRIDANRERMARAPRR